MSDLEIMQNLRGAVCLCGARKTVRQSLCRTHYFALPKALRADLYDTGDYPAKFRAALVHLKLEPQEAA